jgi:hypothetical protein
MAAWHGSEAGRRPPQQLRPVAAQPALDLSLGKSSMEGAQPFLFLDPRVVVTMSVAGAGAMPHRHPW